jgi:hypothetical protein
LNSTGFPQQNDTDYQLIACVFFKGTQDKDVLLMRERNLEWLREVYEDIGRCRHLQTVRNGGSEAGETPLKDWADRTLTEKERLSARVALLPGSG